MDLVGKRIGPYRLLNLIGRGGTAEVYKAFHPVLDRQVAIKILLSETSRDPDWVRRFRREAQLLGQLDHPHILPIFDAGEDQGRPYLVMKYVLDGVTLRSQLDGEPWSLERVLRVLDQVSEALSSAHKAGVVHRDIKPSNILVTPEERYLVFDFGIAKPLRLPDSTTDEGFVVGTPEFMSPEQCRGDRVDQRSDIYSLGIMAYQLLTGQVPFRAQSAVGVLMKHLTAPFPTSPKLTPELNHVLTRAMARSPGDRYSSAREFNEELHLAAGQVPTVTIVARTIRQPLWKRWAYRARQIPKRSLALAGGVALALGLGLGGVFLGYRLSSPGNDAPTGTEPNGAALNEVWVKEEESPSAKTPQPTDVRARIVPKPESGFLSIESDRPAAVLLDGKFIGNAPGEFQSLPPGRHRLKLNGMDNVSWEKDISIYAASTTYVKMTFPGGNVRQAASPTASTKPATENALPEGQTWHWLERSKPTPSEPTIRPWTGYLTDEQCRELGGQQGELHLKSALRCIREGRRPMLYAENGKLYYIEGFERIRLVEDAPLVFQGWLDRETHTIHVAN